MIIIAGDSWGAGEWDGVNNVVHNGLTQYLVDDGYDVINLSYGGCSTQETHNKIRDFLEGNRHLHSHIELIIVFQTEWCRDYEAHRDHLNRVKSKIYTKDLPYTQVNGFYGTLSTLHNEYGVRFGIIGGCSDTFKQEHVNWPGVDILCQSFTNLLVNDDEFVSDPVFFVRPAEEVVELFKKSAQDTDAFINDIDKGLKRHETWTANRNWFYPDGVHANRQGHAKLFNYLKEKGRV